MANAPSGVQYEIPTSPLHLVREAEDGPLRESGIRMRDTSHVAPILRIPQTERNPYEQSLDEQLTTLHRMSGKRMDITKQDFAHLERTAPPWPAGKHAYRSLRVRFGEGSEGVAATIEWHLACAKNVYEKGCFWRWKKLHSSPTLYQERLIQRLRLWNGDDTHTPIVEWVVVDLDAHRERGSIEQARGPQSLADEALTFLWLFPSRMQEMDYNEHSAFIAAGYELNHPEHDGRWWQHTLCLNLGLSPAGNKMRVYGYPMAKARHSYFSVPTFRQA